MRLGSHVSNAGRIYLAVDRAKAIGCQSMQIFIGNPRQWRRPLYPAADVNEFGRRRRQAGIGPVIVHLPYLVNLAAANERVRQQSVTATAADLSIAKSLGVDFLVVHAGSHTGAGRESGLRAMRESLSNLLLEDFGNVVLLLENTAGAGYGLGSTMAGMGEILRSFKDEKRLGLCLDTCHAYAAGYNLAAAAGLERLLAEIDKYIGLARLRFLHYNDCRGALGSRRDRHEQIGKGHIGEAGFRLLLHHRLIAPLPGVIETPKPNPDDDKLNLAKLRRLST